MIASAWLAVQLALGACAAPGLADDERVTQDTGDAPEGTAPAADPAAALADARMNFETVVQSFLAKRAPDGVWAARPPGAQRPWRLRFKSLDKAGIAAVSDQPALYKGKALMTIDGTTAELPVYFTVDLGTSAWRVVQTDLPAPKPAAKKKAKAAKTRAERAP
jgi:hypothetical protein